jgi:hypothetical protein
MEELYDLERRQQKNMQEMETRRDNEKIKDDPKKTPAPSVPVPASEIGVKRGEKDKDRIKEGKELRARASSVARGEGVELTNTGQVRQKLAFGPGAKDVRKTENKTEKSSKVPPGKSAPNSPVKKSVRGEYNQGGDKGYEEKMPPGDRNRGDLKLNSWVDNDEHSVNGGDKGRKKEAVGGIAMVSNDDMFRDNPGGGYLSEYRKKNKEKPSRRHSNYDNSDDMSQNSVARSLPPLSGRRNDKHTDDDDYSLPVIPPSTTSSGNKRTDSHRHPLDISKQKNKDGTGRSGGIVSAPSRIRTGTNSDSADFSSFESESVGSFLPPPVRLSHDYGRGQGGRGLLQK